MRPEPDRVRLAAEALARARADAWARGDRPKGRSAGNSASARGVMTNGPSGLADHSPERAGETLAAPLPASWSERPHREDPQLLNAALGGLLSARGWQQRAAVGGVFGKWPDIVGPQLAAHTTPDSFTDGELAVSADSDSWAAQVRLLTPQLLTRLAEALGPDVVRKVRVRGPSAPKGKRGAQW